MCYQICKNACAWVFFMSVSRPQPRGQCPLSSRLAPMLVPHRHGQRPLWCPFNDNKLIRVAKCLIENQQVLYRMLLNLGEGRKENWFLSFEVEQISGISSSLTSLES